MFVSKLKEKFYLLFAKIISESLISSTLVYILIIYEDWVSQSHWSFLLLSYLKFPSISFQQNFIKI